MELTVGAGKRFFLRGPKQRLLALSAESKAIRAA